MQQYRIDNKERIKQYRINNRELINEKAVEYYKNNKEDILTKQQEYKTSRKEKRKAEWKEYYAENREDILLKQKEKRLEKKKQNEIVTSAQQLILDKLKKIHQFEIELLKDERHMFLYQMIIKQDPVFTNERFDKKLILEVRRYKREKKICIRFYRLQNKRSLGTNLILTSYRLIPTEQSIIY